MTEDVKRIIAGLRFCAHAFNCYDCPATDDLCNMNDELQDKAADLIEQLTAELEQVRRERDAAVRDLSVHDHCALCKHYDCRIDDSPCRECLDSKKAWALWQWRGPCAENGGAE